jgi:hypothetical protein
VYVDFIPRTEYAYVNMAGSASVKLAIQVMNLSPFEVELDRAVFRLQFGGPPVQLNHMKRQTLSASGRTELFLESSMTEGQCSALAACLPTPRAYLDGHMEFNCKVQNFSKSLGAMSGIQLTIVNAPPKGVA